jgi:hypothetical protein
MRFKNFPADKFFAGEIRLARIQDSSGSLLEFSHEAANMKTLFSVTRAAVFGALAAALSLTGGASAQTTDTTITAGGTPQTLTSLSANLSAGATEFPTESGSLTLSSAVLLGGPVAPPNIPLNRYLSIFVSDVDSVNKLKFSQVMNQLVAQSGQSSLTAKALFNQWFDTEAQKPGVFPLNEHCDDFSPPLPTSGIADFTALSKINSFPFRCPRLEENEATSDPFTNDDISNPNAYSAIAFSNRFDLAGAPGTSPTYPNGDCGEYRIVFARNSGIAFEQRASDPLNRNLLIFEARVAHPLPAAKWPTGCFSILNFWYSLSNPAITIPQRGKMLANFYLNGLPATTVTISGANVAIPAIPPIVAIENYTFGHGQIRTNSFMLNDLVGLQNPPFNWTLREFKTFFLLDLFPTLGVTASTATALASDGVTTLNASLAPDGSVVINGQTYASLSIVRDSTKQTAGDLLFVDGEGDTNEPARFAKLEDAIDEQLTQLLGNVSPGDVNQIRFATPTADKAVNAYESDEKQCDIGDIYYAYTHTPATESDNDITAPPALCPLAVPPTPNPMLQSAIQADLNSLGVFTFTPDNVVRRLRTQTCGGCHIYSNHDTGLGGGAIWPDKINATPSLPFTQESELNLVPAVGGNGSRYAISAAVECFLDFRTNLINETLFGLPPPNPPNPHCPTQ